MTGLELLTEHLERLTQRFARETSLRGRRAGDMFLTRDGDLIAKLVVTFDS